jgi:hypothetical protein
MLATMVRFLASFGMAVCAMAGTCPNPPRPLLSPTVPADVCIPDPFQALTLNFFDDYSWRAFSAMVWPAARNQRGVADTARTIGAPGPRVFETFKSLWEVFHDDGSAPTARFNDYDAASANTCQAATKFGDVVLAGSTPYSDLGQAGIGELLGPLVAQNGRYVRYQTLYNQVAYDFLVRNRYYLRANLPPVPSPRPDLPVMQFPVGSVAIKAAWLDVRGLNRELLPRLYKRIAVVRDPDTGTCGPQTVALIGLHIVQKTASRPQWIWSSFEQVDTAPLFAGTVGDFLLNDGTPTAMPAENPLPLVPLAKQPAKPYNVVRSFATSIHPNTHATNSAWRDLLKGTVWTHYRLVTTQWPLQEGNQALPVPAEMTGDIIHTFPGNGPGATTDSAFANLTMETFDQHRIELGCMSCHNRARLTVDFMWSVLDHAYPAKIEVAPSAIHGQNSR